jgi:hypothetical protein
MTSRKTRTVNNNNNNKNKPALILEDDEDSDAMKAFLRDHADVNENDDANDDAVESNDDEDEIVEKRFQHDISVARDEFERSSLEAKVASGTDRDGSAQRQLEELEAKVSAAEAAKRGNAGVQWCTHILFFIAAVYFGWRFISEGGYTTLKR